MIPLITIQGPTGVGKTDFALELAERLNTEIISADSRQIYRFMNIGTAKPTEAEMNRIKHHLIDIIDPDKPFNAGQFCDIANTVADELWKNYKIPIVAGGTAFYIKSMIHGLFKIAEIPIEIRNHFKEELEKKGIEKLYEDLKEIDPESANRININDKQRVLRALEVKCFTGKTLSEHWLNQTENIKYKLFNIMITDERQRLYNRINLRVDRMIQNGLVNEIEKLLGDGFRWDHPGMNSVGYKEFKDYFENDIKLDGCIDSIKQNSRRFAKRQFTWYRRVDFDLTLIPGSIKFSEVMKDIKKTFELHIK